MNKLPSGINPSGRINKVLYCIVYLVIIFRLTVYKYLFKVRRRIKCLVLSTIVYFFFNLSSNNILLRKIKNARFINNHTLCRIFSARRKIDCKQKLINLRKTQSLCRLLGTHCYSVTDTATYLVLSSMAERSGGNHFCT